MNFDQILDKPFLVTTISWSTGATNFTELWRLPFPSSIMSNPLAKIPFDAATFFQARMCCMLQVSGTPMHQGLILVAALPHNTPAITNPNQILCAPHVFLNATESTSVCLECPMYTPSTLYRTLNSGATVNNLGINSSSIGTDVFDLVFFVMDSLTVSSGSSTTISISVHSIFKEAQFYVPKVGSMSWQAQCGVKKMCGFKSKAIVTTKCACGEKEVSQEHSCEEYESEGLLTGFWQLPTKIIDTVASGLKVVAGDLIDYGRGYVAQLTGFHNPNKPEIDTRMIATFRNFPNNVDQPVHLEVMDNHAQFSRIYDDFYFRTEQDEMDLKFLTSKPVFVGKFSVLSTDVAGKNLFAYPITPMVEASVTTSGTGSTTYCSPLRTIYEASRFWRGDLKMHIQAVCTNFHFCKIVVLKNYAMTDAPINATTSLVPQYNNIHNINTDTLEFSAGGQIQTIDLKYCSNLRQLECTKDYTYNSIAHGIAYGYLVQPLTYNSNVPTTITFNVYISGGEDLQFSGYALDPVIVNSGPTPTYPGIPNFFKDELGIYEINNNQHTGRIITYAESKKTKLQARKDKFFVEKPSHYIVEEGDNWEDIAFITGNTLESIRNLNASTHNYKSKAYSMTKGPLLTKGEKLVYKKCWIKDDGTLPSDCYEPEGMEMAQGTNALVTPNSQDALLNQQVPVNEDIKMSFRPNTSVRDYLRFMYPQTTYSITPNTIKNVVAFDINTIVNNFSNADCFHSISSLFLGTSGGFKLKFKISGVANASAVFVPPSVYAVNGSYLKLYPMSNAVPADINSLASFNAGMPYTPSLKSFTPPQIEMQDYTRPFNNAGTSIAARPGSSFVLEMAIPNMNPFNFVGNSNKWYLPGGPPQDIENDYGVVYICYDASFDGSTYAPMSIIPFVGINDETRLGFQVFAPIKTISTYTSSSPAKLCRNSILHPVTIGTTLPNGIPVSQIPMTGSCYYFNTT